MARTLSDEDIDAIAARVIDLIVARLSVPKAPEKAPPAPPTPQLKLPDTKLAYTLQELSDELGISKVSLSRFEVRGC